MMSATPEHRELVNEAERHARLVASAQAVKVVSIDDVTVGQLMWLLFKLLLASIPVALVVAAAWYGILFIARH